MVWVRSNMCETLDTSETSQMVKQVIPVKEVNQLKIQNADESSSVRFSEVQYSSTLTEDSNMLWHCVEGLSEKVKVYSAELFGAWQLKELLLQEYQAWQLEELLLLEYQAW